MFNQRVGRTLDRPRNAAGAQQPAHERRLAAAEFAMQRHDIAAAQARREALAGVNGRLGIGQMQRQC